MAKQYQQSRDRRGDVESLAAALFVQTFTAARGSKLPEALAGEALAAARAFYRLCDESPAGLGTPDRTHS